MQALWFSEFEITEEERRFAWGVSEQRFDDWYTNRFLLWSHRGKPCCFECYDSDRSRNASDVPEVNSVSTSK